MGALRSPRAIFHPQAPRDEKPVHGVETPRTHTFRFSLQLHPTMTTDSVWIRLSRIEGSSVQSATNLIPKVKSTKLLSALRKKRSFRQDHSSHIIHTFIKKKYQVPGIIQLFITAMCTSTSPTCWVLRALALQRSLQAQPVLERGGRRTAKAGLPRLSGGLEV